VSGGGDVYCRQKGVFRYRHPGREIRLQALQTFFRQVEGRGSIFALFVRMVIM